MCYTPILSLLLLKTIHISILKDFTRVDQTNPLLSNQSKLGFWPFSSQDGLPMLQVVIMPHHVLQGITTSSFKSHKSNLLIQLLRQLKINCVRQKVNCGQHIVKLRHFLVNIKILKSHSSFDQRFIMIHQENSRFDQKSKLIFTYLLTRHNFHILYQKFFHQSSFSREFNSLQLCVSQDLAKNASFESYRSRHYRSF